MPSVPALAAPADSFPFPAIPCAPVERYPFFSIHQLHEHLIRNAQFLFRKPNNIPLASHQSDRVQGIEPRREGNSVIPLNTSQVDSIQLPQPQKQFFLERTLRRQLLFL